MIDHLTLGVTDVDIAKPFYDATLSVLGYKLIHFEKDDDGRLGAIGYGLTRAFFWVCRPMDETNLSVPCNGNHIAFRADTKQQVHDFHAAALANGGSDEGSPGPRPQYHSNYYAAYVRDPAGHKIEIVWGNS